MFVQAESWPSLQLSTCTKNRETSDQLRLSVVNKRNDWTDLRDICLYSIYPLVLLSSFHPLNHLNLSLGIPVYPTFLNGWPSSSRQSSRLGMQPTNRSSPSTYPPPGLHVVRYPGIPFPLPQILTRPIRCPLKSIQLPQSSLWPFCSVGLPQNKPPIHPSKEEMLLCNHHHWVQSPSSMLAWKQCHSCVVAMVMMIYSWASQGMYPFTLWGLSRGAQLCTLAWSCISVALHIACKCDSWTI